LGEGPLPARTALGVSGGPLIGIEVPMIGSTFALLHVQGLLRYLPVENQSALSFGLQGFVGVGTTF
jgi:hypothetical protein